MYKNCIKSVLLSVLFSSAVFAQGISTNSTSVDTREILEASDNLNKHDVETILSAIEQGVEVEEGSSDSQHRMSGRGVSSNLRATSHIYSDSWQVVRVVAVQSEDYPFWDYIPQYSGSITPEDHGGSWLLVATLEKAFQPLFGFVDADAKFRYWNMTQIAEDDVSDSIYTSRIRYWYIENNFTSGEFKFTADYSQQVGYNYTYVHLNKEIDIK